MNQVYVKSPSIHWTTYNYQTYLPQGKASDTNKLGLPQETKKKLNTIIMMIIKTWNVFVLFSFISP